MKTKLLSLLLMVVLTTSVWADTLTLRPNGQGAYSQWTNYNCGSGSLEWQCVDESLPSTADYLYTGTKDKFESFTFQDTGLSNELVNSVTLYFYGQRYSSSKYVFQPLLRFNTTYFLGNGKTLLSTYSYHTQTYSRNPATGIPWTVADVNNLQAGMKSSGTNGGGKIAQVYAVVDYSHPNSCSDTDGGNTISLFGRVSGYLSNFFYSNDDYCQDADTFVEYFCNGTSKQSQQQSCGSDGYSGSSFCVGNSIFRNYTDYSCGNGACSSNSSAIFQQDCLTGQSCSNGQCLASDSCTDSDGGFVRDVLGNVTGYRNQTLYGYSDFCANNVTLTEYYCSGPYWNRWNYSCAGNGTSACMSGRCV